MKHQYSMQEFTRRVSLAAIEAGMAPIASSGDDKRYAALQDLYDADTSVDMAVEIMERKFSRWEGFSLDDYCERHATTREKLIQQCNQENMPEQMKLGTLRFLRVLHSKTGATALPHIITRVESGAWQPDEALSYVQDALPQPMRDLVQKILDSATAAEAAQLLNEQAPERPQSRGLFRRR